MDAENAFVALNREGSLQAITSTYILLECGNAAARRPYRQAVYRLRQSLETVDSLVTPTEDDWTQAWEAYRRGEAGQAGIVDHTSFAIMRRLKIQRVFSNDAHFRAAGFETLF